MRKFLIDTDTASDDAVALIMALRANNVQVKAITVVSGNVPLSQATRNALYTTELCGADEVPVYAGVDRPHLRTPAHADWFHGKDGLGNQNYPPPARQPEMKHAADAIIDAPAAHRNVSDGSFAVCSSIVLATAPSVCS